MNEQNKKLVIFDFDGVLVNTLPFSYVIHKEKNPNFTWEEFQDFSNGNFIDSVNSALNNKTHNIPINFSEKYKEEIEKINIKENLYESIVSLGKQYKITIVSSTPSSLIDSFLIKENLRNYFSDILGSDINRSKIIKINSLLKKYNILPKDTVFITDSLGDILEGNECGVKSIGVTWGIHGKENLEKGHPVAIIDNPKDLLDVIRNVF
ncbi:MAG: HAD family hydrolase [Candidatus Pacebacteria bacterium]|nr:HAD family hydrolase [Candidatus Paceibacterota bacterium]